MTKANQKIRKHAHGLLEFLDECPTAFHAVAAMEERLSAAGFVRLAEEEEWSLESGGRYYVIRNGSALIAFQLGQQTPSQTGFRIVGAHTDSPALKVKPLAESERCGYVRLGVEVYGGPILATWLDRDLSLAGRVSLQRKGSPLTVESRLVHFKRPLLSIPNPAIHLNRGVNDEGLKVNKQTHLPPILSLANHTLEDEKALRRLLASELKVEPEDILGHDLYLFDLQKATLSGVEEEFIHSGRLDNLSTCHAGLVALLETSKKAPDVTAILACYDNEEIGSNSAQGAGSPFLLHLLERVCLATGDGREAFLRSLCRSIFISADMAHAVHPNWPEKHDEKHTPQLNKGPVIKLNANIRYATDSESGAIFARLCDAAGVPVQYFVTRSDMPCGSTIGPISSTRLGIKTVDVGNPMLAMHSIREMCGSHDPYYMYRATTEFFRST